MARYLRSPVDVPRVTLVAGARPNFVKLGPVVDALRGRAEVRLLHTGQHYDERMSQSFFRELGLPAPDVDLGIGSASHAAMTAAALEGVERDLLDHPADAVVVVGDVNSTLAAALAATKLRIDVAHVEAGLRSRDWAMPEEVNRVVVDRVSSWLLTPSPDADANLLDEGTDPASIHRVGNVMIDTLLRQLDRARAGAAEVRERLGVPARHGVLTLHRPSNVDQAAGTLRLVEAACAIDEDLAWVFPMHPRTRAQLDSAGTAGATLPDQVRVVDPQPYVAFLGLTDGAALVATDSGGIQEETSVLGVPCLTLRTSTERPITLQQGTNVLAGTDPERIVELGRTALAEGRRETSIEGWDGHAGERVADVLLAELTSTT